MKEFLQLGRSNINLQISKLCTRYRLRSKASTPNLVRIPFRARTFFIAPAQWAKTRAASLHGSKIEILSFRRCMCFYITSFSGKGTRNVHRPRNSWPQRGARTAEEKQ